MFWTLVWRHHFYCGTDKLSFFFSIHGRFFLCNFYLALESFLAQKHLSPRNSGHRDTVSLQDGENDSHIALSRQIARILLPHIWQTMLNLIYIFNSTPTMYIMLVPEQTVLDYLSFFDLFHTKWFTTVSWQFELARFEKTRWSQPLPLAPSHTRTWHAHVISCPSTNCNVEKAHWPMGPSARCRPFFGAFCRRPFFDSFESEGNHGVTDPLGTRHLLKGWFIVHR